MGSYSTGKCSVRFTAHKEKNLMTHNIIKWVAVIDGKHAQFYIDEEHHLRDLKHTLTASPARTDKPSGRGELGRVYNRLGDGKRHIVEPHTSDRVQEHKMFVHTVADYLEKAIHETARNKHSNKIVR
ncbi:MAG: protein required for attachment to host cells [Cellvibrionaceae bacterium]|jgi:protein required for attachment to host cells